MNKFFNAYNLKIIAIVGMILQHAAMILEEVIPFFLQVPMHFAGGLTFPIMAFFLVEGAKHTSNIKKYLGRIFVFAVISQVPYVWAYGTLWWSPLNIMFILFLGLLMVHLYDNMTSRGLFWFLFVIFLLLSFMIEWGIIGLIMILMHKTIRDENKRRFLPALLAGLINGSLGLLGMMSAAVLDAAGGMPELAEFAELGFDFSVRTFSLSVLFGLGSLLAIFFLKNYNGERGKSMKYFFYVIYPLHFVILALLALVLNIA